MKVIITGSANTLSIGRMWYEKRMGEVFEVEIDPNFSDTYYKTIEPIYKEHQGHIKFEDCRVLTDELTAYGSDCKGDNCA